MKQSTYFNDYFLIAMPTAEPHAFHHAVIYICEHSGEGAIGIIVNQPTTMQLGEVFQQMDIPCADTHINPQPVLVGGPLDQDRGFIFHKPEEHQWRSTINFSSEIAITTSRDILESIAENKGPTQFVLSLGYAGWAPGQLEDEIKDNLWLTVKANQAIVFDIPFEARWQKAVALLGIDASRLTTVSGHA